MSAIWPLWASALVLLLLAMAVVIWPLMREADKAPAEDEDRAATQLRRVYQAQREELERDLAHQTMGPADRAQALEELQRRLLDDTDALAAGAAAQAARAPALPERVWLRRSLAGLLALALPVAALALYLKVGDPQAAATVAAAEPQSHATSGVDVDTMVSGLASRLAQAPDDVEGWIVLARSYEVQEQFQKAADAYRQAIAAALRGTFPAGLQAKLHADLADALASARDGQMDGPVEQALADALRLDPLQPKALALAGSAAVRRGDAAAARQHWQQLLAQLEPGTDMALRVQNDLQRLDGLSGAAPVTEGGGGSAQGTAGASAPLLSSVHGTVRLGPAMATQVREGDTLFIAARAEEAGRTPVAVLKLDVGSFPVAFTLDDRHAMSPELRLSRFRSVTVQAWVSRSGSASRTTGQPTSTAQPAGSASAPVELVIDHLTP